MRAKSKNKKSFNPKRNLRFETLEKREVLATIPLAGDWDGDGEDTPGYYDTDTRTFTFHDANVTGLANNSFRYGPGGNVTPLAGDWNGDGIDTFGVFDNATNTFFLKDTNAPGTADHVLRFGAVGTSFTPITGDWDFNGTDTVGIYNPLNGEVFLKNDLTPGAADITNSFTPSGGPFSIITGNWNGVGGDSIGLVDTNNDNKFYLVVDPSIAITSPGANVIEVDYGPTMSGWTPLGGDWNGNGTDTIALVDPNTGLTYQRFTNTNGTADRVFFASASAGLIAPLPASLPGGQLTAGEVADMLDRASAATTSNDAIIAIVDRAGRILGVRVESGVTLAGAELAFAIDGAVSKARTAAFFANGDPINGTSAPLTSRTVRFISQSTVTEREVNANPNETADPTVRGPGFIAPIGLGGHFPPEIQFTPPVDLFAIEHTNRDSLAHPGPDGIRAAATVDGDGFVTGVGGDDVFLENRFNTDSAFIPAGQEIFAPEAYGVQSGLFTDHQNRGIATLPGGIPIYRDTATVDTENGIFINANPDGVGDFLVGGIGVFFPGPDGYASFEQEFIPGIGQTEKERTNATKSLEAELIALAAIGGSRQAGARIGTIDGVAAIPDIDLPFGRLDLVGIRLEVVGPHPRGLETLLNIAPNFGFLNGTSTGTNQQVTINSGPMGTIDGTAVPDGWLVLPHASTVDPISAADVERIIAQAVAQAEATRAAVRLPLGSRTRMVFSVADTDGNILGLYRMKDATVFSIDVAVAKARNTAYFADPVDIDPVDLVDENGDGIPDQPPGVAYTNRTFRYLAEPRFPESADGELGPFSILNDPGINPNTAENLGAPTPFTDFQTVLGFDAFNPATNFRDPDNGNGNQNGIVFFPGSAPLYSGGSLIGGFGVSGDGVDQDDVVTFFGYDGFRPEQNGITRADQVFVRGVRLPYQKFLRNPEA